MLGRSSPIFPLRRFVPHALLVASLLPSVRDMRLSAWAAEGKTPGSGIGSGDLLGNLTFTSDRGPLTIDAQQLEFDYRTRTLTYRGNVVASQGDLVLKSDILQVLLDESAPDTVRQVIAEGNVQINQGTRAARGGRAVFDQEKRTVTLSDRALLRDGPNEVAGERVVVYLDEQRSVVEGGERRVKAILFPSGLPDREKEAKPERDG